METPWKILMIVYVLLTSACISLCDCVCVQFFIQLWSTLSDVRIVSAQLDTYRISNMNTNDFYRLNL